MLRNNGKTTNEGEEIVEISKFDKKIWLASPYMHGDEQRFLTEVFDIN